MFKNFERIIEEFKENLNIFGAKEKEDYIFRNNTGIKSFIDGGAYFGCISKDESETGVYSDLCIVIFPSNEKKDKDDRWIIAFAVGSQGFKNDEQLASLPGTR